jgi:hypothetical protein
VKEKDPFEKYDKLFDEQDKKHDQQVKAYRNDSKLEDSPSFDDLKKDEYKSSQRNSKESSQAIGIVISIVVGIVILRNLVMSSSPTFFGSIFPIIIIIGITSSIYKYFKNKR